jgi:zinc ribbon protein
MMAVQTLYCGRCGSPLLPGAAFCGRCGTPQVASAQGAPMVAAAAGAPMVPRALAPPPAAPPAAYGYRVAQPGAFPGAGRVKVPQGMVIGGVLVILAVAVVAISTFAVYRAIGTHPPCTANCGPQLVPPLPEANAYHSTAFGFDVDYSSNWKVRSQDANGVSLTTQIGILNVVGSKANQSPGQLIDSTVRALPSSRWQSVVRVSDLKGAHIGDQDGQGAIYSANLIGSGATSAKIRFAVIAATRGGVAVVIFAADPADTKNYANGIPEGQEIDYLCQEFRWG